MTEVYIGVHLIIDLWEASNLDNVEHIENTFKECILVTGATLLHIHLHHFTPGNGVTGVAILAESHMSIHTWPEHGYAAVDIFMCGKSEPYAAIEVLNKAFKPGRIVTQEFPRGIK